MSENNKKPFYIIIDIHEGDVNDTISDLKEMLVVLRKDFIKDSQTVFGDNIGETAEKIKKYETMPNSPVGFSLIKKICKGYGLKCKLKIYRD